MPRYVRKTDKGVGTIAERFWRRVEKTETCWLWRAGIKANGYGTFSPQHGTVYHAHRYSYALNFGPIGEGLEVLHRCDNPSCVRPDHLFLGTQKENMEDMRRKGRARWGEYNRIKTHCSKGHEFVLVPTKRRGVERVCRICRREGARRRYRRDREHAA